MVLEFVLSGSPGAPHPHQISFVSIVGVAAASATSCGESSKPTSPPNCKTGLSTVVSGDSHLFQGLAVLEPIKGRSWFA